MVFHRVTPLHWLDRVDDISPSGEIGKVRPRVAGGDQSVMKFRHPSDARPLAAG
jgi:hypothetical protein